jgi:hypothetical protein
MRELRARRERLFNRLREQLGSDVVRRNGGKPDGDGVQKIDCERVMMMMMY